MSNEKHIVIDTQKKRSLEEDDDTSKQATQNYDLNDNEQEVRIDFFILFIRKIFILFYQSLVNSNRILTKYKDSFENSIIEM